MTKYLDDFLSSNGKGIMIEGQQGSFEWYDKPPVGVTNVMVKDCEAEIDFGKLEIAPGDTCGLHVIGGAGHIRSAAILYDDAFSHGKRGVMVNGAYKLSHMYVDNPQIGILLMYMGSSVTDSKITNAQEDHIRFMTGFVDILNNECSGHINTGSRNHRDCIQGVAANWNVGKDDFLSNPITNVKISGNLCESEDPQGQGIMALSDGVGIDWDVSYNRIFVPSTHGITFNRLQSSTVRGNETTSNINIGSRKQDVNRCGGLVVTGNTASDIQLIGETMDCLSEFSGNKQVYDLSPMNEPTIVK